MGKANAEKYGIDTSRMAISGCSAGGRLAALVGLTKGMPIFEGEMRNAGTSSAVNAIIDIDGVIGFLVPPSLNLKRQPTSPDMEWLGGSYETAPATWKAPSSRLLGYGKDGDTDVVFEQRLSRFSCRAGRIDWQDEGMERVLCGAQI